MEAALHSLFWRMARDLSTESRDPSTKVGAVIVGSRTNQMLGGGWNEMARHLPREWLEDREKKYAGIVHAEVNAILTALRRFPEQVPGSTLFSTAHPCADCAKLIIHVGVGKVICPRKPWRDSPEVRATVLAARKLFSTAQVLVEHDD